MQCSRRMPEPWKTFNRKTADSLVLFRYSLTAGLRLKSGLFLKNTGF